jgi:hypothetical protein
VPEVGLILGDPAFRSFGLAPSLPQAEASQFLIPVDVIELATWELGFRRVFVGEFHRVSGEAGKVWEE